MKPEEAKRILMSDADFSGTGENAKLTADALCVAVDALDIMTQTCRTCLNQYNCMLRDEYYLEYCSDWQSEIIKDGEDDE